MSRFFATGDSSSDDDESEREEEEEEEESEEEADDQSDSDGEDKPAKPTGMSRFMKDDDSDDDENKKRVVKSQKDKRWEQMQTTFKDMKNHIKINDWNAIHNDFEQLNRQLSKANAIVMKEGIPNFYFKALIQLEDFLVKTLENKEAKKKMSSTNAKSLNTMKQKIKKHNAQHEVKIQEIRDAGTAYKEDVSDDDSDPDWDPDADSEDEEEKAKKGKGAAAQPQQPNKPKTVEEFDEKDIDKRLDELLAQRGRKGTDRNDQLAQLRALANVTKRPSKKVELLIHIVVSLFDMNFNMLTAMPFKHWKSCLVDFKAIIVMLSEHPDLKVELGEQVTSVMDTTQQLQDEEDDMGEQATIGGDLLSLIERLDDEYYKSMQLTDPHSDEYVERLKEENSLIETMDNLMEYYKTQNMPQVEARIAIRIVEHYYYKTQELMDTYLSAQQKLKEEQDKAPAPKEGEEPLPAVEVPKPVNLKARMSDLTVTIYSFGTERSKTRALLAHVYHHALHDRFYQGRDLMLMSHLQDAIQHSDINTQILYNRALVRLGICAFQADLVPEAHSCLTEICSGGRVKELLAQGVSNSRYAEKNPEQEKAEKRRQVPYHQHINLEMIECVHLVTAMLLEVPNMAASGFDPKRRQAMSKPFRRLLDHFERQVFTGPPENSRDVIMTGARAMLKGNWQTTRDSVVELKVWALFKNPKEVRAMVGKRIQEEGLRTYMLSYAVHYHSLSLTQLAEMFDLPENSVHSTVSKMIINEELHASWYQPTNSVVMHNVEATKLQYLAQQFSDKATQFVENNERLLDSRTGGYGYKYEQKQPYTQKDRPWQGNYEKKENWNNNNQNNYQRQGQGRGGYKGGYNNSSSSAVGASYQRRNQTGWR